MSEAPLCAAHDPNPRKPKLALPPLACDTHMHFYDARFPTAPTALSTQPDATPDQYRAMQRRIVGALGRRHPLRPFEPDLGVRQLGAGAGALVLEQVFGDGPAFVDLADEVVGKHERTLSAPQVPSGV